jgi:coenzyme F420-0:L-glutamate ligase/coenzyme F420-1:gamma-L-glutamate ligase
LQNKFKPLLSATIREAKRVNPIQIIAIEKLPLIEKGDNLAKLIVEAAKNQKKPLQQKDIIVVTHVVVSKAEGNIINLDCVTPSEKAKGIAAATSKDPALVEIILQEAKEIVRVSQNSIITETVSGIICANAGVDRSNVSGDRNVVPLPKNPNASAEGIRKEINSLAGVDVAVIVSDTHGRPFRMGEINVAIGVAGIKPIRDRRGEKDLFGFVLKIKQTAIADELASAAELVIGQANEGIPAAIIRGYSYHTDENASSTPMIRAKEKDIFR